MKDLHELLKYKECYYYDFEVNKIRVKIHQDSDYARELYKKICDLYFKYDHKYEFDIALSIVGNIDIRYMNVIVTYLSDAYFRTQLYNHILHAYLNDSHVNHKRYIRDIIDCIIEIIYAIIYEDYVYMIDIKKDYLRLIDYEHLKTLYNDEFKHIFDLIENQIELDMFNSSYDALELLKQLIKNELNQDIFINEIKNKFKYILNSFNDYYNHYHEFNKISYYPLQLFKYEFHQFMCLCQLGLLELMEHDLYNKDIYIKDFIRKNLNLREEDLLLQTKLFMILKEMI